MSGVPAQSDVDAVTRFFAKCRTIHITEERYFPSTIQRDSTLRDICDAATKVLAITKGNATMQSWELPCLFNGSGAGKTYINYFARSLVQEYLSRNPAEYQDFRNSFTNSFRIYFKQVNGLSYKSFCGYLAGHLEPNIHLYFKWFIASQLLLPQDDSVTCHPEISGFGAVMKGLNEKRFLDKLDYSIIFAALRQQYNIAETAPIWIFVSHDEMQFLTGYKTLLDLQAQPDPDAKRDTVLYQYLMESMSFAQAAKSANIHVLNIFSGTFRLDITEVLEATGHRWRVLKFDPLSVEDGVSLLSAKHPLLSAKMNTPLFKHVLSHFGNIPRIWRDFSKIIGAQNNPSLDASNLAYLNELLKREIRQIYGRTDKFNVLLLLTIQNWTIVDAQNFLPASMLLLSELQNVGLLFVIDEHYYVPPILLRSLVIANYQLSIKRIITDFPDRMLSGMFTPTDFEEFCIGFFTLKRNLLVSQGIHKIQISEFFKGAWIVPEAMQVEISLAEENTKPVEVYKTHSAKLQSLKSVDLGMGDTPDMTKRVPVALWIGNSDPHQDGVLILPGTLIQFEMKYSVSDAQQALSGYSSSSFESEQKKAENSPLRNDINGNKIFVYATNCRITADEPKRSRVQHRSSIIICANNFKDVFSPTFDYVTTYITKNTSVAIEDATPEVNKQSSEEPRQSEKDEKETSVKKPKPRAAKSQAKAKKETEAKDKTETTKTEQKKRKTRSDDSEEVGRQPKKPKTK